MGNAARKRQKGQSRYLVKITIMQREMFPEKWGPGGSVLAKRNQAGAGGMGARR